MGRKPVVKSRASLIRAAEKRRQALELRKNGATFAEIAEIVGYSGKAAAYNAFRKALADIPREAAEAMREIEGERLDAMHAAMWRRALRGDTEAIAVRLRILDKRARLFGLNIEPQGTPPVAVAKPMIGIPLEHLMGPDV